VQVAPEADVGPQKVVGYALYAVCGVRGGVCRYLRQDFTVSVNVDPQAPSIQ
jgi:hypothetical protein